MADELITPTLETIPLIYEETQRIASTEQVLHSQEIEVNHKTIPIILLEEDRTITMRGTKTMRLHDLLHQQEMITTADLSALVQTPPDLIIPVVEDHLVVVVVDRQVVAEEVEEDKTEQY